MKIQLLNTGFFKLDGGAMFGVVPKQIWNKLNPADENNLCTWALRCLLVEDGNKLILIDAGIGNKQKENFLRHYHLRDTISIDQAVANAGYNPDEVTDVVLTHFHFDHCGGALTYGTDETKIVPTFKNATYWTNDAHWLWATEPNPREKASFLSENILPLQEAGQLSFIPFGESPFEHIEFLWAYGHTEGMMIPHIQYKDKTLVFVSDLIPSVAHLPVHYVMGYDTKPLITMEEKENFLTQAVQENYVLIFQHDPIYECCTLTQTDKGVRSREVFNFSEVA
ncbi:MAG: MBL fold metallo-hydrolase [Cytophagaceae bacterium]|nr:MBL fold metallo-hydrolase [Cytophagaceae bacterium]MDW8456262.1 MBL fold metallo-hydrolase [Cytophagaceae bacterium]